MVKTEVALVPQIVALVKSTHPYTVPEVITAELGLGNPDYYKWLSENVAQGHRERKE